ncbi:hypothetical protein Cgig2_010836 [Carnegiea gigantea]|uniref:Uncharacterized protein n=1 Tax=Carnegiea gigantea TaxID=171969 RepID=A0A9Q1JT62_9CARY|nr:hypothetical protein Cgig2_010836 [Carnegiea gigantea]
MRGGERVTVERPFHPSSNGKRTIGLATVRESSSRASRDMAYEQMSTPTARLRAVEVELEKDRTRTKQSKVNTSWLKAAKNKMIKAFGSWVIDTNVPFTMVDSIYNNPLLETIREVGPDVFLYKDRMDTFGTSIAQRAIVLLMPGFQEAPSNFTGPGLFASSGGHDTYGGFSNNYGYNTNYPPLPYPSNEPQFVGSDSSRRHSDNPPIINQGTINYGDHHYYRPTFYRGDSNLSEQSWMDSTASSHYHQQQKSYGINQNNNDTYQDPPHHSF